MNETETVDQSVLLHLHFVSDRHSIGGALERTMHSLDPLNLTPDELAEFEILLAEVINNIAEHAYDERTDGPIEMELAQGTTCVRFELIDRGQPMPNGQLPLTKTHNLNCGTNDLPEGGFGWNLIYKLGREISYMRLGDENHLSVSFPVADSTRFEGN